MDNHKNIAIIITIVLITLNIYSSSAAAATGDINKNTEFIRKSCFSATIYPALCYSSLSSHASAVKQDPKLLAQAALAVSLDTARSASADMVRISRRAGLSAREAGAMRDCVEELSDSVGQIRKSMPELVRAKAGPNFEMLMSDVQTWVSAAMTDDETCMDGFAGKSMNGPAKTAVRGKIVNVSHVTSNALALINSYASSHHRT